MNRILMACVLSSVVASAAVAQVSQPSSPSSVSGITSGAVASAPPVVAKKPGVFKRFCHNFSVAFRSSRQKSADAHNTYLHSPLSEWTQIDMQRDIDRAQATADYALLRSGH